MRPSVRGADGCLLMIDIADPSTLEKCKAWKKEIDDKCFGTASEGLPCVLLGNKVGYSEHLESYTLIYAVGSTIYVTQAF